MSNGNGPAKKKSANSIKDADMKIEEKAEMLYETYSEAVGGVAYNGDPLPSWAEFSADPEKEVQAEAWREVARKAAGGFEKPVSDDPLTDEDPMPFGKHKGKRMKDVPADYLHWCYIKDVKGGVAQYIEENLEALQQEYKDGVWIKER
jgi:uncharacterized protein (DUF3820 family)